MLTRSEALRSTRANALKQLAFLDAKHPKCLSPKMLDVVRKTLFTSLLKMKDFTSSILFLLSLVPLLHGTQVAHDA